MTIDMDTTALRRAMQQWREPLKAMTSLPFKSGVAPWRLAALEDASNTDEILWLSSEGTLDHPEYKTQLEAAELFALLAHVDFPLWKALVREWWLNLDEWDDCFEQRTALTVGLGYETFMPDTIRLLCDYILTTTSVLFRRSDPFEETRMLLARVAGLSVTSLPVVPLKIVFFTDDDEEDVELHHELHDILLHHLPNNMSTIRITQLETEHTIMIAKQANIDGMEEIRKLGIQVIHFPMVYMDPSNPIKESFTESIGTLLDAWPSSVFTVKGIEKMQVRGSLQNLLVPAVYSAIHSSKSLREISFDIEHPREEELDSDKQEVTRRQMVMWTAFALFRREALASVTFDASKFSMQDAEVMEQVLTAENPLALLFPEENLGAYSSVVEALKVLLYDPLSPDARSYQRTRKAPTPVALHIVGERQGDFVPVLLPGWGKAWAHDAMTVVNPPTHNIPSIPQSPKHFKIEDFEAGPALLRLLGHIGRNIQHLELGKCESPNTPLDAFCTNVLSACPNLKHLELKNMELTSLEFLLEAFQAKCCPRLEEFTLCRVRLREQHAVEHLLKRLDNPREAISVRLRELTLSSIDSVDAQYLDAVVHMLKMNTRLRHVSLVLRVEPELKTAYAHQFKRLSRITVGEPLTSKVIVAFLSVVTIGQEFCERKPSAMQLCDSRILSHILSFAATPRVRTVQFTAMTS